MRYLDSAVCIFIYYDSHNTDEHLIKQIPGKVIPMEVYGAFSDLQAICDVDWEIDEQNIMEVSTQPAPVHRNNRVPISLF